MQDRKIRFYKYFLNYCKRYKWLLGKTPIAFQQLLSGGHYTLEKDGFFDAVMQMCGITPENNLSYYMDELLGDELIKRTFLTALEERNLRRKWDRYEDRILLNTANVVSHYALIRESKPNIIVETGTASGSMTSWVMAALEKNGKGKLISIDIPPVEGKLTMDITVSKEDVGYFIPREYHDRWDYLPGDAKLLLPKVLADNEVDIFIHDSLHTRSHMAFEYNLARCLLKPGKIIMSDDILWNNAFLDFVNTHQLPSLGCITNPQLGITVNTFDSYELEVGVDIIR